jgi:hypothetical protein
MKLEAPVRAWGGVLRNVSQKCDSVQRVSKLLILDSSGGVDKDRGMVRCLILRTFDVPVDLPVFRRVLGGPPQAVSFDPVFANQTG